VTGYQALRAVHILSAVLLLGNVIVTGVWAALGMREPDAVPHRLVARGVILTDWWFTVPGGACLTASGVAMALMGGLSLWDTPFVRLGLLSLAASTTLWLAVLVPLQMRWARAADRQQAHRLYRWWSVVGWSATAPLLFGLWVMATHR
jgi:uncharacterized membrane protein